MKRTVDALFLLVLWLTATACPAQASEPAWRARAVFEVIAPGLVEVVLPPDLVEARGDETHDLVLTGPDHQPRAFELFWRDPVDRVRRRLTPGVVQLTDQHILAWEAEADGNRIPGKDYAEQCISVQAASSVIPDGLELELILPGAGLQIQTVELQTKARFQGRWEIGRYGMVDGRKVFQPVAGGRVNHVSEEGRLLILRPDRQWPDRSMVVRLFHGRNYIGRVEAVQACVRLPRLLFLADTIGTHLLTTGTGAAHPVFAHSRRSSQIVTPPSMISGIETNPAWHLDSLTKKYQLRGAPFDPAGYTWKSILNIPGPGYYRLQLSPEAALGPNPKGMRLVHQQSQVPFFMGREEIRQLTLEAEPLYDRKNNCSIWDLQLPLVSRSWHAIELESKGIFNRRVELLAPKAASSGWQSLTGKTWEHRNSGRALLSLPLPQTGQERDRLRLVIAHGDNQPIAITHIRAQFYAPLLFFLAHEGGTFELFGGNQEAPAASYDLSLIQGELKTSMPEPIAMTPPAPINTQGWKGRWHSLLREGRWGFYVTLALATAILIVMVTRLFPNPACGDDQR